MSASLPSLDPRIDSTALASVVDPFRNPSYPKRVHFYERAELEEALRKCDERLGSAFQKLSAAANHAQGPRFVYLFHQLQGSRDQVAEAVRRLPLEVGGLYHEDLERFEQAVAAMDRVWQRWEQAK